jgi:hypothetical protein
MIYLAPVGIFLLGLLTALLPKLGWWMTSWQYSNPDAVEPSDASFTLQRFGGVVLMVIAVVLFVYLLHHRTDNLGPSALSTAGLPDSRYEIGFELDSQMSQIAGDGNNRQLRVAKAALRRFRAACATTPSEWCDVRVTIAADYGRTGHVTVLPLDGENRLFCLTEPSGPGSYTIADGACVA